MFRIVLTILTAATFVAHGLFGCCWHHGHGHLVSRIGGAKPSVHCHGHGPHRHTHHESGADVVERHGGDHDSHSPQNRPCDEDQCVFARTQDGPHLSGDVQMAYAVSLVAGIPGSCCAMPRAELSTIAAQNHSECLSAPVCALSQLWLI